MLLLTAASTPALAQQPPSLADRETARSLMDEGDKKRDSGDLRGALKSYEAADAIMNVPTTGLDVARTQAALGMLLEARETLARVIRTPVRPNEPAPFVAARKAAETLNEELSTKIPSIQLVINGVDPNRPPQITVDGEPVPFAAASAPRKVNPGKHVIVLKVGLSEQRQEVTLAESETRSVTIDAQEVPPSTQPAAPLEDPIAHESSTPRVLMIAGFSVAAIGVGVGAVTGLMSLSKESDLEDACPNGRCAPQKQDDIDSTKLLGNVSTIAFVAGGIGAGVGVVGLVLSKRHKEPPSTTARVERHRSTFETVRVTPVIEPSYAGIRGTF